MHENGEPATLGFIEVIEAGELTLRHIGRQVSFPYAEGRTHGRLMETDRLGLSDIRLIVNGQAFHVDVDTPVSVVVQSAAEAAAERRAERRAVAKIVEENTP